MAAETAKIKEERQADFNLRFVATPALVLVEAYVLYQVAQKSEIDPLHPEAPLAFPFEWFLVLGVAMFAYAAYAISQQARVSRARAAASVRIP